MKTQTIQWVIALSLILGFCIGIASAYEVNAGEPIIIDLEEEFEYYSITGNLTPTDLNITINGTIVTIIPNKYLESSLFNIIFYSKSDEIIHSGSSGGSKSIYQPKVKELIIDKHGCLMSEGFFFCETRNMCVNDINDCPKELIIILDIPDEKDNFLDNIYLRIICGILALIIIFGFIYAYLKRKKDEEV